MSELNIYGVGASQNSSDYIGFTFNGVHSDTLGIKRTSEGSRFNENLLPTIQDKTVQVPGGDGMYHFGSYYTQRQFNVSYAFDALTEQQLAEIKRVFGDKKIHELIFDEAPYKAYQAKVTGSASIKHIPFAEGETNRIYKGEGSIQFTAYDPYARSVRKFLNQYVIVKKVIQPVITVELNEDMGLAYLPWNKESIPIVGKLYRITYNDIEIIDKATLYEGIISIGNEIASVDYHLEYEDIEFWGDQGKDAGKEVKIKIEEMEKISNLSEWKDAANLLEEQGEYDKLNGNIIKLYNPGVKETDFVLTFRFDNRIIPAGKIFLDANSQLSIKQISRLGEDTHIKINTKLNLNEGYV